MRTLYILFLLLPICFSFSKQNEIIEKQLHGIWEPIEYKEGVFIFKKKKRIRKKHQSYHFKNDEEIFMRLGGRMCGSDKTWYSDETAKWNISSDSLLTIEHEYSTTIFKRNFKFLKIENSQLYLKKLEDEEIKK